MGTVLTIEDDEVTAQAIVATLKQHHFSVEWVDNGRDGMVRAVSGEYDAITLDRMLPGLDGLTIVTTMLSVGTETPVLMLRVRCRMSTSACADCARAATTT